MTTIKNVTPESFQGRYWRGICIATIGGVFRLNFKTTFDYKDEVKQFCKERGGTWDAVTRCWFVPIDKQKLSDGTANEWVATAIAEFGEGMKIGNAIEWCLAGKNKQDAVPMFEKMCFAKFKKQSLTVVDGGRKDENGLQKVMKSSKLKAFEKQMLKNAYDQNKDIDSFCRELVEVEDMGSELADLLHVAYYLDGKIPADEYSMIDVFAACENSGQSLLHLIDIPVCQ